MALGIKKFNPRDGIDPKDFDYFYWGNQEVFNSTVDLPEREFSFESSSGLKQNLLLGLKYGVKVAVYYIRPEYLLFNMMLNFDRTMMTIHSLVNLDWESIKLKVKGRESLKQVIREAQNLSLVEKHEEGIQKLCELETKFELIDSNELQSELLIFRANYQRSCGYTLNAADDYIGAALLIGARDKQKENGKSISKKALLYYMALRCIREYIEVNGVNDEFSLKASKLSLKIKEFAEKEASYRDKKWIHGIEFNGLSLPKIKFDDKDSAELNRHIAEEAMRIDAEIGNKNRLKDLSLYLQNKEYRDYKSVLLHYSNLEEICKLNELPQGEEFYNSINDYIQFAKNQLHSDENHFEAIFEMMNIEIRSKLGLVNDNDLLKLISMLRDCQEDPETFLSLLLKVEKINAGLSYEKRVELITLLVKENFNLIQGGLLQLYNRIAHQGSEDDSFELKAMYPLSVKELEEALDKLESPNYELMNRNGVYKVELNDFKKLMVLRGIDRFGQADMASLYSRYNFDQYENVISMKQAMKSPSHNQNSLSLYISQVYDKFQTIHQLSDLIQKTENRKIKIGVYGQIKVGKSTLVNSLLRDYVVFGHEDVATNIPTIINKGESNQAIIQYINGDSKSVSIDDVKDYTSEQFNPLNEKEVARVEIKLEQYELDDRIEIVDVPGFNADESNFSDHYTVIEKTLDYVDAVLLLTLPIGNLKKFEMDFIHKAVNEKMLPFVLVLNRIDDCEESQIPDVLHSIEKKLKNESIQMGNLTVITTSGGLGEGDIRGYEYDEVLDYPLDEALEVSNIPVLREKINQSILGSVKEVQEINTLKRLRYLLENHRNNLIENRHLSVQVLSEGRELLSERLSKLKGRFSRFRGIDEHQQTFNVQVDYLFKLEKKLVTDIVKEVVKKHHGFKVTSNRQEDYEATYPYVRDEVNAKLPRYLKEIQGAIKDFEKEYYELEAELKESFDEVDVDDFTSRLDNLPPEAAGFLNYKYNFSKVFSHQETLNEIAYDITSKLIHDDVEQLRSKAKLVLKRYEALINKFETKIIALDTTIKMNDLEIQERKKQIDTEILEIEEFIKTIPTERKKYA